MSNEGKDWFKDREDEIKINKQLIARYPWLEVGRQEREYFGDVTDDENDRFCCTWIDDIPDGWFRAFGMQWIIDIDAAYQKLSPEQQKDFCIVQLKEKYGSFRQYFNWYTDELAAIANKYEDLSEHTCIDCGAPATHWTEGWITPVCAECAKNYRYVHPMDKADKFGDTEI